MRNRCTIAIYRTRSSTMTTIWRCCMNRVDQKTYLFHWRRAFGCSICDRKYATITKRSRRWNRMAWSWQRQKGTEGGREGMFKMTGCHCYYAIAAYCYHMSTIEWPIDKNRPNASVCVFSNRNVHSLPCECVCVCVCVHNSMTLQKAHRSKNISPVLKRRVYVRLCHCVFMD